MLRERCRGDRAGQAQPPWRPQGRRPPLDPKWTSYVGAFRVPYVHGLTMGELARMAKEAPDVLKIPDALRARGRLTVIPMRGWRRSMRWPDTGLKWVPTSTYIPDFAAVEGFPMTGLGCERGGFRNGIGSAYRSGHLVPRGQAGGPGKGTGRVQHTGDQLQEVSVSDTRTGKPELGLYVEITDWDQWRPPS